MGRGFIIITLILFMDTLKLFSSTSKMLPRKVNKTDRDLLHPLARSLSRNTTHGAAKLRLEESRTFIGTPRGSAGELNPASKLWIVQSKTKGIKKEKISLEKTAKPKKKDKKKKETSKKERDARSREKDVRFIADRINELKLGSVVAKRVSGKAKGEKKTFYMKDVHTKTLLKKRLTLDEDELGINFGLEQKSPKNYPGSPKDDMFAQNQLVIQRLKKCLDSRPLRQINEAKMKKSFKGDLVSKIKSQAEKLARKASKDLDNGSSPAVDDLMTESHRELVLRSKRSKEAVVDSLIEKLKTELSVSTDKRSTNNHSPVKLIKDRYRANLMEGSGKLSPQPRLSRSRKMPAHSTSKKESNKSQDKKQRGTAETQGLRFSQNFKQPKQKQAKGADYLLDYIKEGREDKDKKQKGLTFFHTLSNFKSSEICKFKLTARANLETGRPITAGWMLTECPIVASISEESLKTLELRLVSSSYLNKSQIQERTDKEFESRPDFADRRQPTPIVEMADLGAVLYRPETRLSLLTADSNKQASKFLDLDNPENRFNRDGCRKSKPKGLIDECMEDIPNLPLEVSIGTPVKEAEPKPRVKPLIINRGAAGIYSTSTFY